MVECLTQDRRAVGSSLTEKGLTRNNLAEKGLTHCIGGKTVGSQ